MNSEPVIFKPGYRAEDVSACLRVACDAAYRRATELLVNGEQNKLSPVEAAETVARAFLAARRLINADGASGSPAAEADESPAAMQQIELNGKTVCLFAGEVPLLVTDRASALLQAGGPSLPHTGSPLPPEPALAGACAGPASGAA